MAVSTEQLMAYLDGELPPDEARLVEAEMARDPALRAEYDRQKALGLSLHNAFAPVLDAPVPERLIKAVRRKSWFDEMRALITDFPVASGASIASAALAAGLAIGLFVVPHGSGDFASGSGGVVARGELAKTLQTQLAANQDHGARTTVGVSFRDGNGRYCRTFTADRSAGVACHESRAWHVIALAPATLPGTNGSYRMAAGEMPDAIRDSVTSMQRGNALDAKEEARAQRSGWRD